MRRWTTAVLLAFCSLSNSWAKNSKHIDQLEKFKSLNGPEQVAVLFDSRFHGRSLLFWKHSSEVFLTEADARLSFEQDILVASDTPGINGALVAEINGSDIERARYAVFLLCLRTRFVPHSEFFVKQINGLIGSGQRAGRVSPFPPDLTKLDKEAIGAIGSALVSPNSKLRNSTKIYTFAVLKELSSVPTSELAERWKTASKKVPACFQDSPLAYSDDEQVLPILRTALASRGLEAAVAVSSLLKTEHNPETLSEEIEMVRFLDSNAVRLRRSEDGRKAIQSLKDVVLRHPLQYCWMRYDKTEKERQKHWLELEDQFLRDRVECGLASWATLIALALDQEYGDQMSVPSVFEKERGACGVQMRVFLSRLTDVDPNFPAWEFPSTGTPDDMLHPLFAAKLRRYHEMWTTIKMETSQ